MSTQNAILRLAIVMLLVAMPAAAQQLPLPSRSPNSAGGRSFGNSVAALPRDAREARVFEEVMSGNVPSFLRNRIPVELTSTVGGILRRATIYVAPEYLAIGSDDDYFLIPMSAPLAQRLAEATGCVLPTRKVVDEIYRTSPLKLTPQPIPPGPAMITVPVFMHHHDSVWQQRRAWLGTHPPGTLTAGHKKDIIVSNRIYTNLKPAVPKPVVIYGWHQPGGVPIQPVYNGHEETYADYSHGVRLVRDTMVWDGKVTTVRAVLRDSVLASLVSDEGIILRPGYSIATGVLDEGCVPADDVFGWSYPNPSNGATTLIVKMPSPGEIDVMLYDALGREVRQIIHQIRAAGSHAIPVQTTDLPSGRYFFRILTPLSAHAHTLCLIR